MRYGKVSHARMGVGITDVTPENAKFFDMHNANGAVITQVESDSAGSKAGLKVGDVITEINGKKVTDAGELQMEVGEMTPGTEVALQVMRDGKSISVPVTLEPMDGSDRDTKVADNSNEKPRWGVGIGDLTPDIREQLNAPDTLHGAVIERVQPGSPSDDAGLQPGEVIVGVDRHETGPQRMCRRRCPAFPRDKTRWCSSGPMAVIPSACCTPPAERSSR